MSTYHLLGISHAGMLSTLTSSESKDKVLAYALEAAPRFRQLFLLRDGFNIRELRIILPPPPVEPPPPTEPRVEEGDYSPLVLEK